MKLPFSKPVKIFISYRRSDSGGHARHLYDSLARYFGEENIFMDVASIKGGDRWLQRIDESVSRSQIVLVLIGKRWVNAKNSEGARRLDQPNDFVVREIATGISKNKRIIPILLDRAEAPGSEELPDDIKELLNHQFIELTAGNWNHDLGKLLRALPTTRRKKRILSAVLATSVVVGIMGIFGYRVINAPSIEQMTGSFNIAILEFGTREPSRADLIKTDIGGEISDNITGIFDANSLFAGEDQVLTESELSDVRNGINTQRIYELIQSTSQSADLLSSIALESGATLLVYGVIDLTNSPPVVRPMFYLTPEFTGDELLVGESILSQPIRFSTPLSNANNLRALQQDIAQRMQALKFFVLGLAYLQIEDYELAYKLFRESEQREDWTKGKEVLKLFIGTTLLKAGRDKEAARAYTESLSVAGYEYPRAWVGLGNYFEAQGKIDRAVNAYESAIRAASELKQPLVALKASSNMGLALSNRHLTLGSSCEASETIDILRNTANSDKPYVNEQVAKNLEFKAVYQLGLLYQDCGSRQWVNPVADEPVADKNVADKSVADKPVAGKQEAIKAYQTSIEYLQDALVRSTPQYELDSTASVREYKWQWVRWLVRYMLGYTQLELAGLGFPELRQHAVENFDRVIADYENDAIDVPDDIAVDTLRSLELALQPINPTRATEIREKRLLIEGMIEKQLESDNGAG